MPENLTLSPLAHPELGLLGNHISEKGLCSFMMVLHEPSGYRARRNTAWGGVSTGGSASSSRQYSTRQKELFTIDEEKI